MQNNKIVRKYTVDKNGIVEVIEWGDEIKLVEPDDIKQELKCHRKLLNEERVFV